MVESFKAKHGTAYICDDGSQMGDAAAKEFVRIAKEAIAHHGLCSVALSGGSTPHLLYERLLKDDLRKSIDWAKVHFFVGDERCVPHDSKDSNFGNACREFLDKLSLPAANLHPTKFQDTDPNRSAAEYERELQSFFKLSAGQLPRFDVIFLGMGPDGHCASLFPGTAALQEKQRLVVANHVEKLNTDRITFTYPVLNNAAHVVFMIGGADKAPVLSEVLQGSETKYPVQGINPVSGKLEWFVERAAAQDLKIRT